MAESEPCAFYLGEWCVEPASSRILRDGETVRLEPRVMDLLVYLAQHPRKTVTREELEAYVWGGTVVGYDALTQAVIKLRRALHDDPRHPQVIETVSKRGYRLITEVNRAPQTESPEPLPTDAKRVTSRQSPATRWLSKVRSNTAWILIAAVMVLALALLWWTPWNASWSWKHSPLTTRLDKPSIVVLPFTNLSTDPGQEYFTEGIGGDITTDLSRLESLRVIARQTARGYKGKIMTVSEIADELGVRYVIEGSVQKAGKRLRINVTLTDAKLGYELWAQRYDRLMDDLFAIQDEMAHKIVDALALRLSDEEHRRLAHRYTANIEAYDLFLQGQAIYIRLTSDDNLRAQQYFHEAIALDPDFARAYAALSLTHADDWRHGWTAHSESGADEALRYARRAIELDPALPQARFASAYIHLFRGEHREAIRAARRAIDLDANHADAYVILALSLAYAGMPEQAIPLMGRAMALNPAYGSRYATVLGTAYYLDGDYLKALSAFDQAVQRNPARISPRLYISVTSMRLGRTEDAEWHALEALAIDPTFSLDTVARLHPFRDAKDLEKHQALLRRVGLN